MTEVVILDRIFRGPSQRFFERAYRYRNQAPPLSWFEKVVDFFVWQQFYYVSFWIEAGPDDGAYITFRAESLTKGPDETTWLITVVDGSPIIPHTDGTGYGIYSTTSRSGYLSRHQEQLPTKVE